MFLFSPCNLELDSKLMFTFSSRRVLCPSSPAWIAPLWRQRWWVTLHAFIKQIFLYSSSHHLLLRLLHKQQVQFDRYLSSPDTLVMPQLNFLLSAAIKWVPVPNVDSHSLYSGKELQHSGFKLNVFHIAWCFNRVKSTFRVIKIAQERWPNTVEHSLVYQM